MGCISAEVPLRLSRNVTYQKKNNQKTNKAKQSNKQINAPAAIRTALRSAPTAIPAVSGRHGGRAAPLLRLSALPGLSMIRVHKYLQLGADSNTSCYRTPGGRATSLHLRARLFPEPNKNNNEKQYIPIIYRLFTKRIVLLTLKELFAAERRTGIVGRGYCRHGR